MATSALGDELSLRRFMRENGDRYYAKKNIIGGDGDFITSPEMSQVFGELVGAWLVEVWRGMGSPSRFIFTELGVGRGFLAADMFRVFKLRPEFLAAARWHMLEVNRHFRRLARANLPIKIHWHRGLASMPRGIPHIMVANEFFDALPIEQYKFTTEGWRRAVFCRRDRRWFRQFRLMGSSPALSSIYPLPERGQILEKMSGAVSFIKAALKRIGEHRGHLLVVDYGGEDGIGDTLKAIKSHRVFPLATGIHLGETDFSANVDFSQLRRAAGALVDATRSVGQAEFLQKLGLQKRVAVLAEANRHKADKLQAAVARLIGPPMGELFRVMAFTDRQSRLPSGVF